MARTALGTTFFIGRGATPTYTPITGLGDLKLPAITTDKIDTTSMDNTDGYKTFITGMKDGGSVDVPTIWEPGSVSDVLIRSVRDSGEEVHLKWVIPASANKTFTVIATGVCEGYAPELPFSDVMRATATFKVSRILSETLSA